MTMASTPRADLTRTLARAATGILIGGLIAFAGPAVARADTVPTKLVEIRTDVLAEGLDQPWAVEELPDGSLILTELGGAIRVYRDGKLSAPLSGVPKVAARGQGGLLDVALANDFAVSRTLFLSYAASGPGGAGTAIARARLSDDNRSLTEVTEIFRMARLTRKGQHFGSRIAVARDGTLYFTIGDRGEGDRAQDTGDHAGAVLRINPDGTIPADNPHPGGGAWLAEIWSKGHRNPQGAAIDQKTGTLFTVEHGARGGDEINMPEAGKNYGWPVISYGRHYAGGEIGIGTAADGYEQPIHYWDPSIAPGGMAVYRGAMFPEWDGDLFVAALKFRLLVRLDRDPETGEILGEERMLKGDFGRIRDVVVASDGALLIVTDESDGQLIRISRAG